MGLSNEELQRMSEDEFTDRHITSKSLFCGGCGYSLKSLPYVYNCPECGNAYNARPRSMSGIFLATEGGRFPLGDIVTSLFCLVIALVMAWSAMASAINAATAAAVASGASPTNPPPPSWSAVMKVLDLWRMGVSMTFAALFLAYVWRTIAHMRRFLLNQAIRHRIDTENE